MSGLNILDETTLDLLRRSFIHYADTEWGIVSVDDSVLESDIRRAPHTDGISDP